MTWHTATVATDRMAALLTTIRSTEDLARKPILRTACNRCDSGLKRYEPATRPHRMDGRSGVIGRGEWS
jgi:hypothetical protein